jgi:hypothetical protein
MAISKILELLPGSEPLTATALNCVDVSWIIGLVLTNLIYHSVGCEIEPRSTAVMA